jgi:hypothetical protein
MWIYKLKSQTDFLRESITVETVSMSYEYNNCPSNSVRSWMTKYTGTLTDHACRVMIVVITSSLVNKYISSSNDVMESWKKKERGVLHS